MSSKASQQPQQQSSWRTAASKPYRQTDRPTDNRQSSPQEQHPNGQRNGFNKFDSWEKPGPVDRSDRFGRNGSPAGLTPSSKSSTKPPSASASPFEAADNMMPSFARHQQRNSTSNLHQQQQQQQQFQPQGSNSIERNGSMIGTNTHNQQDDKVNQEKRKSSAGEINGEHNKQTNADNEQMRKSNKKSSSSSSSPPPEMDGNNDKQVEQKEQMAEQTKEQSIALASPEAVIKHPLKNKWAMW